MIRKIRQAAVIGSGVMGGGIAALMASAGIRTLLLDIVPLDLKEEQRGDPKARNRIVKAGLDAMLAAQPALIMSPGDADRITIGNLEDDVDQLARCDWIIEVVVENVKIKRELFQRIDAVRGADAIVSTNTSGLPLKTLSEGLSSGFQAHFLGTHFFNPVRYMKLLEIIPGAHTQADVLDFVAEFAEHILGKGIVWAKDTPNFVGNRIGVQGMTRAMQLMVEEGLSIAEVDALFGPAMGRPKTAMFKTADLVGLDVMGHVAKNTYDLVPDDEAREHFVLPDFFHKMVKNKLLGKKTHAGFYKTDLTPDWQKIRKVIDLQTLEYHEYDKPDLPCLAGAKKASGLAEKMRALVFAQDMGARFVWRAVADNLIYAANRIPEIADTLVEIDNAMRWGFNFEMGPFETWDALGVERTVERMEADGLTVPDKVKEMLAAGHAAFYKTEGGRRYFFDFDSRQYRPVAVSERVICLPALKADDKRAMTCGSASLVDLGDGVFCCEFHTKMNALNGEIIDFMDRALDYVDTQGVGLVIGNQAGGMPGAFSAGADLSFMRGLIEQGKFDEIGAFIKKAQDGIQRAKYSGFPVVAAPYGLTLGGGCEVCLGADRMLAHAELYMGLVEIGVGLLPSGGGCTNLWKKFVQSVPDAVTDMDLGKFFVPAFMNIALAKVSTSAADARSSGFLGPRDRIVFNRDYLIGEAKKEVLDMAAAGYAPPVKRPIPVVGEAGQGMIEAELSNMRAARFISSYDAYLAGKIAFVLSGGQVRTGARVDEDVLLTLERKTFVELLKQEKTVARIDHMLKTGKPLRN
ncbi:MAG: 3-hydroxyacyl-CoA dehydrogenase NAD-binding domain-containing protein [Desulfobacteraceae bacterium]